MKRCLIIGASGGIGRAIHSILEQQGAAVTSLSRSEDGLDLMDETATRAILEQLSGPFDLVLVATGALEIAGAAPEKTIKSISAQAMMDQFALNAVGPALILREAQYLLPRKGRSVFAVLSARVGSIGDNHIGGWISYRAAKAAVNQIVRTSAIELARTHRDAICVALHPGTVATSFTEKYLSRYPNISPEMSAQNLLKVIGGLSSSDTGGFFDWAGKRVQW